MKTQFEITIFPQQIPAIITKREPDRDVISVYARSFEEMEKLKARALEIHRKAMQYGASVGAMEIYNGRGPADFETRIFYQRAAEGGERGTD